MTEIVQVLKQLDELFVKGDTGLIQNFLEEKIACFTKENEKDNLPHSCFTDLCVIIIS